MGRKNESEIKEVEVVEEKEIKKSTKASKKSAKDTAIAEFVESAVAKKGFTYKEIVDFMGEKGLQPEDVDSLYAKLEQAGVEMLDETKKERLRGAIKFFSGDRANVKLEIVNNGQVKPCGGIYFTDKIFEIFKEIVSSENIKILN